MRSSRPEAGRANTAPTSLVSTQWLAEHLADPDVRVLDCRWYLQPFDQRDGDVEYRAGHIPTAQHVNWERDLTDPLQPGLNLLAPPELFGARMEQLGIGDDTFVVAYDDHHVPVAARMWWSLRVYGHERVAVLDGGFTRWRDQGHPIETGAAPRLDRGATFTSRFRRELYATKADVLAAVESGDTTLVDGRMDSAFNAASGHIPGAVRVTGIGFLEGDEQWMNGDACRARLAAADALPSADRPVIAYCGGGVAATAVALAYHEAGLGDVPVYDGSWTEWERDPDTPKELH